MFVSDDYCVIYISTFLKVLDVRAFVIHLELAQSGYNRIVEQVFNPSIHLPNGVEIT